jgi:hypothetical protein
MRLESFEGPVEEALVENDRSYDRQIAERTPADVDELVLRSKTGKIQGLWAAPDFSFDRLSDAIDQMFHKLRQDCDCGATRDPDGVTRHSGNCVGVK